MTRRWHVEVNDDWLITCSIDKTVKVWDLRNLKCLQTMQDKTHSRPENRISALRYDPVRCQLLTRQWPRAPLCRALQPELQPGRLGRRVRPGVCVGRRDGGDGVPLRRFAPGKDDSDGVFGGTLAVRMWLNGQCLPPRIEVSSIMFIVAAHRRRRPVLAFGDDAEAERAVDA